MSDYFEELLKKIDSGCHKLERSEVLTLLKTHGDNRELLFEYAKKERYKQCKNKVYIRGIIDISNYCRCKCLFCGNSRTSKVNRYRMSCEEIIAAASKAKKLGLDMVHLASGEDPGFDKKELETVIEEIIKMGLKVELVLGKVDLNILKKFYDLGADRYIMKFETSNQELYKKMKKCDMGLPDAVKHLKDMKLIGFNVGTGNIIGLPNQTLESIADDILLLHEIDVDMASTSVFTPNSESELASASRGNHDVALNYIALLRLMNKNKRLCIPSNSTLGIDGKITALEIGSNVLSLNLTPEKYAGKYSIYDGKDRYKANLETIKQLISGVGFELSTYKEVFK